MKEMSGSRFLFSGVGTQMMTASIFLTWRKSVEAEKLAGLDQFGDGGGLNVFDIAAPLRDGVHLGAIHVQPQDGRAGAGELERQGKAHITQTDDGNFHVL